MNVKYVVMGKAMGGEVEYVPFENAQEAEKYAKAEAKRLLSDGPVLLFVALRSYSAVVDVQEKTEMLK